jgi:hypothetical protein
VAEIDDIRREADGRPSYEPGPRKKHRDRKRSGGWDSSPRKKQPTASPRSSEVAQAWYDAANRAGMDLPYDVNYLALAIQRKVIKDPVFRPLLQAEEFDKVTRLLHKMTENFWTEYVDNGVNAGNVKDFYLQEAWDDLREYARTNLRAAYLRQHGRRVDPPEYPRQKEFRDELKTVRVNSQIERMLEVETPAVELDETNRERLRSWRQARGEK